MPLYKSIVEDVALTWFVEMGYPFCIRRSPCLSIYPSSAQGGSVATATPRDPGPYLSSSQRDLVLENI